MQLQVNEESSISAHHLRVAFKNKAPWTFFWKIVYNFSQISKRLLDQNGLKTTLFNRNNIRAKKQYSEKLISLQQLHFPCYESTGPFFSHLSFSPGGFPCHSSEFCSPCCHCHADLSFFCLHQFLSHSLICSQFQDEWYFFYPKNHL